MKIDAQLLLVREAGHLVPEGFLKLIVDKHQSGLGYVELTKDGLEVEHMAGDFDLAFLRDLMKSQQPNLTAYYFCSAAVLVPETDIQPFVTVKKIEGGEELARMVTFIDGGDLEQYEDETSGHTRHFNAHLRYFHPKINKVFTRNNTGDMNKTMEELRTDPEYKQDFMNSLGGEGSIMLMSDTGNSFAVDNNSSKKVFPWGYVSEAYGYAEAAAAVAAPEKKEETAKEKLLRLKAEKAAKDGVAPITAEVAAAVVALDKPATAVPALAGTPGDKGKVTAVMAAPPARIKKLPKVKEWYRQWSINGTLPANPGMRPEVACKPDVVKQDGVTVKSMQDLGAAVDAAKKVDTDGLLSTQAQDALINKFLKTPSILKSLGLDGNEVTPPREVQELEEKLPTFVEKAGLEDIYATMNWSRVDFRNLATQVSIDALVMLCADLRDELFSYVDDTDEVSDTSGTGVGVAM